MDMVAGRPKQVLKSSLARRDQTLCKTVDVVAMGWLTGFTTAAVREPGTTWSW